MLPKFDEKEEPSLLTETKFHFVTNNIQEGVILLDAVKKVTYISPACLRLFGYSYTDDLNELEYNVFTNMHPEDMDLFFAKLTVVIAYSKTTLTFIANISSQAAKYILVELNACVYYDDTGKYSFAAIICNDLTANYRHEQSRLNAIDQLKKIAGQVPGVIYQLRLNPDGSSCMPYASPGLPDIAGASPLDVKDDAGKFYASIHTDDMDGFIASMEESAEQLSPWQHEYRRLMPGGEIRFFYTNAVPEKDTDGSILWNGFITDITARRRAEAALHKSEARFKEMFDTHSAIMLLLHPETGRIIDVNEAAVEFYGYGREILNVMNISDLNPMTRINIENMLLNAITGVIKKFTVPQLLGDGTSRTVQMLTSSWDYEGEQVIFAIINDVTDTENEAIILKEHTAALQASNRHLENFAYVASHDLQEPLRMVSSFLQALEKRLEGHQLDEKSLKYLHIATDGAARMQLLINDLLLYSKISGSSEKFTMVDMNTVIDYITLVMANNFDDSPVIQIDNKLPDIRCSKTLITQLFMNLVKNAIKYKSEKKVEISIGYTLESEGYIFYVKDNGIGIDEENYEQIFELFKRLHTREEYAGSGIGLALCKRIAEIHNGRIWVESTKNESSTFYFSIPRYY